MTRTLTSKEAIEAVDGLLSDSGEDNEVTIAERNGDPIAVVISPENYRRLVAARAERDWQLIDDLRERNRDIEPAEVERDIAEAIEEVRLARRGAGQQVE